MTAGTTIVLGCGVLLLLAAAWERPSLVRVLIFLGGLTFTGIGILRLT